MVPKELWLANITLLCRAFLLHLLNCGSVVGSVVSFRVKTLIDFRSELLLAFKPRSGCSSSVPNPYQGCPLSALIPKLEFSPALSPLFGCSLTPSTKFGALFCISALDQGDAQVLQTQFGMLLKCLQTQLQPLTAGSEQRQPSAAPCAFHTLCLPGNSHALRGREKVSGGCSRQPGPRKP